MDNLYNLISRSHYLREEIKKRKSFLLNAPSGMVFSRKNLNGTYRYFKSTHEGNKRKEIYLKTNQRDEAVLLARKQITEMELKEIEEELMLLEKLISLKEADPKWSSYLKSHPGLAALLLNDPAENTYLNSNWKNQPYKRNYNYPQSLIFPTVVPDLMVRSKAEADILSRLEYYKIQYHYDEIIKINNMDLAIDFICLNSSTNAFWYWDHRGRLDDPQYIKKTIYCETQYLNGGIIPWINMIVTTETKDHPLDIQWVDHLIKYYLL